MLLKTFVNFFLISISFFYSIWSLWMDNGVTVSINVPENIKPGQTVTAEVIINKGTVGGFAKLQIDVGQGLTIAEEDSKGATFSFSGNTAKWIWTALPMESEFKVKFKLTANASASGNSSISAKFSYIVNNAKQVAEAPTKQITIGEKSSEPITQANPEPLKTETTSPTSPIMDNTANTNTNSISVNTTTNVAVETTTSVTSNESPFTTSASTGTANIQMNRTIENIAPNTWLIKISIQKDNVSGFARYSDVLPSGLKAQVEEKDGSSFFVDGSSIKFVWSKLPKKSNLNISYKLSGNLTTAVTLNGEFSYTENNQVMSKKLNNEIIQPSSNIAANNTNNPTLSENNIQNVAESSTKAKETAVFFSVQLGAFLKSSVTASYFANKYKIKNIKQEQHESYKKFYSGNFSEYKSARDYREEIKTKGIQDAFVIAHKNYTRITVQEALMITNQKWYP
jgi:hypothetical protein